MELTSDTTLDNDITAPMKSTSFLIPTTPLPSWSKPLDNLQLALTIIGVIANLASLITLIKNGKAFQVSTTVKLLSLFHHSMLLQNEIYRLN